MEALCRTGTGGRGAHAATVVGTAAGGRGHDVWHRWPSDHRRAIASVHSGAAGGSHDSAPLAGRRRGVVVSAIAAKRLGVWGASRVGKTSLLAMALFGNDPVLRPLVQGDSGGAVNRELFDVYRRLVNNEYVPPT